MSRVRCAQVREAAPELALGLLTGRERAAHLAHLERCGSCRAEVSALAVMADDVLLAGPRHDPPPGFDRRVLDRLAREREIASPRPDGSVSRTPDGGRRAGRRWLAVAAVVLALVGTALGGVIALGGGEGTGPAAEATAPMLTGRGRLVGEVTVRGDDPAVVAVELPGWPELVDLYGGAGGRYWLAVELDDGSRTLNRIPPDDTAWEVPLRAAATDVAAVSVVDREGRAWCTGRFPV